MHWCEFLDTLHHNHYEQVVERRSAESEVHCGYDSLRA